MGKKFGPGLRSGVFWLIAGLLGAVPAAGSDMVSERGTRHLASAAAGTSCPIPANASALRSAMLAEVNARRRAAGMGPLRPSPALERAAMTIACDNARRGRMDHVAQREGDLRSRVRAEGYRFRSAAEALAHGYRAPDRLAGVWQASAYHRPTLMTPSAREAGIAVVLGANGSPWWAMISAQPR